MSGTDRPVQMLTDWDPISAYLDQLALRCNVTGEYVLGEVVPQAPLADGPVFLLHVRGPAVRLTKGPHSLMLQSGEVAFWFETHNRTALETRIEADPSAPAGAAQLLVGTITSRESSAQLPAGLMPPVLQFPGQRAEVPVVTAMLREAHALALAEEVGSLAMINQILTVACLELVRAQLQGTADQLGGWLPALQDAEIGLILANMLRNPAAQWTVESLADVASMARSTFARRFAQLTGQTPMDVLTSIRMRLAADLLRSSMPLKEVARQCGYRSISAFTTVFRRQYGKTPRQYRIHFAGLGAEPELL